MVIVDNVINNDKNSTASLWQRLASYSPNLVLFFFFPPGSQRESPSSLSYSVCAHVPEFQPVGGHRQCVPPWLTEPSYRKSTLSLQGVSGLVYTRVTLETTFWRWQRPALGPWRWDRFSLLPAGQLDLTWVRNFCCVQPQGFWYLSPTATNYFN